MRLDEIISKDKTEDVWAYLVARTGGRREYLGYVVSLMEDKIPISDNEEISKDDVLRYVSLLNKAMFGEIIEFYNKVNECVAKAPRFAGLRNPSLYFNKTLSDIVGEAKAGEVYSYLITESKNFDELECAIHIIGEVPGSSKVYTSGELKDILRRVKEGELDVTYITRTYGLRRKVAELLGYNP